MPVPSKPVQYTMATNLHNRIRQEAAAEELSIREWMDAHFTLYFAEVDAIEGNGSKGRKRVARV